MLEFDVEKWLAVRKEAGLKINSETAELTWVYALTLDPYGVYSDLPEECQQVGREYFARSPQSDIWVSFKDLPEQTHNALWHKHKSQLAFPAGLEDGARADRKLLELKRRRGLVQRAYSDAEQQTGRESQKVDDLS
jgi:hypothetical protein